MTRKFCTRWEFLPPPIAEGQGFARARESNTRQKFCSILVSPQFPATPLIALLWEGKLHLDLERAMSPSMPSIAGPGTKNVRADSGQRQTLQTQASFQILFLGCCFLFLEHMSMHVARVDKSGYCTCLFACWRSMAESELLCLNCFQDSFGFA